MTKKIVFSDVDGTLLDSKHELLPNTLAAIRSLQKQDIPFVIISARSPSGIYSIHRKYGFKSTIISYSGALIIDVNKNILYSKGFTRETARAVISFIEDNQLDCTWNVYSMDTWITNDKENPRVKHEENAVQAQSTQGNIDMFAEDAPIGKMMCMCNPNCILDIEQKLKKAFPELSIAKSSTYLLEIMPSGVTKSTAVKTLCELWNIPLEDTIAFGDNYNDLEMLETVAQPFLMANAPDDMKKRFPLTASNNDDGIYKGLLKTGLISAVQPDSDK